MAKSKQTAFFCSECGYESSKWMGQCPGCHAWNTMVEEPLAKKTPVIHQKRLQSSTAPATLADISTAEEKRVSAGMHELDRVLGGGIVPGSLILVGGDPGIGKSTLLLQVCRYTAAHGSKVLYISGEESLRQIKMRANRLGTFSGELYFLSWH